MADKIAHRGPDDAGYLYFHTGTRHKKNISFYQNITDNKFKNLESTLPSIESTAMQRELHYHDYDLYMGHRRLSILDVSYAGHQPMSDLSKNIWISYNGEIYNFKELRSKLKKLGHKFKSNTDTEVIIYSYIEWGIDCIKKFNGMFAFSLYDNYKKKFYLCRDRYGIKPVYYHITKNKTFIYGSEIKSILEYKDYKSKIDKEALVEYFTFQNIFTNKTLHKNIQILEAGHYFEIDLSSKN
jgi:asparagine synthase (glutamine-hydrolysing)